MSKSLRQYREHLASIVGEDGKVEGFTSPRGGRGFTAKCRYCWDSPHTKVSFHAAKVSEVATAWLAHEASAEHAESKRLATDAR